jgi:hypothetical protein
VVSCEHDIESSRFVWSGLVLETRRTIILLRRTVLFGQIWLDLREERCSDVGISYKLPLLAAISVSVLRL